MARVRASALPDPADRKRIRLGAGLSLRALGDALGVSAPSVQAWEAGTTPRPNHAVAYRRLLDDLEAVLDDAP